MLNETTKKQEHQDHQQGFPEFVLIFIWKLCKQNTTENKYVSFFCHTATMYFQAIRKKQINDKSSSYLTQDLTDPDCSQHLLELAQGFGKVKGDDFESNQTQISPTLSLSELSPSCKRCSNALLSYFISQSHAEQPRLHKTCPSYLEDSSCDFSFPLRYPKVDCLLPPPILHIK